MKTKRKDWKLTKERKKGNGGDNEYKDETGAVKEYKC